MVHLVRPSIDPSQSHLGTNCRSYLPPRPYNWQALSRSRCTNTWCTNKLIISVSARYSRRCLNLLPNARIRPWIYASSFSPHIDIHEASLDLSTQSRTKIRDLFHRYHRPSNFRTIVSDGLAIIRCEWSSVVRKAHFRRILPRTNMS